MPSLSESFLNRSPRSVLKEATQGVGERVAFTWKGRRLCFQFSTLGWLSGQWEMGMYFSVLESHETSVLISTCLSCSLATEHTEMSLGSTRLPGVVCRAELSTQRVGWAL